MSLFAADSMPALFQATFVLIILAIAKVMHALYWKPLHIQRTMAGQGILGPPYRSVFGNTRQVLLMHEEALHKPLKHTDDILHKVQPQLYTWAKSYGKIYLSWFMSEPTLNISETEMAKQVLSNKDGHFVKVMPISLGKMLLGCGLLTAEGENWVKQRKLAYHAFHGESLKEMVPVMVASVYLMLKRWKGQEGKEVEVLQEFGFLSSEVIARTAFESSYEEGRHIFQMISRLATLTSRNFFTWRIPGLSLLWTTADEAEGHKLEKSIQAAILEVVRKREAKMKSGEMDGYRTDFLGQLLAAKHEYDDAKRISIDTVVNECKTFFFGGQETTNSMLGWTVFLLPSHPLWQEEARKEVLDVFGNLDPTFKGAMKLRTMIMILNESLRLYSPVTAQIRKIPKRTTLGNIIVPANFQILVANININHDLDVWGEDAHVFKPDRFSEGIAKATNNNMAAFLPFGLGPQMCVGNNFVLMDAKVTLAMILQRYFFSLSQAYVHCPFQHITIRPLYGIQVIFRPITP